MSVEKSSQLLGFLEEIDITKQVSSQYLRETLDVYEKEHIYLESAVWNDLELIGTFRLAHYPYIKEGHEEYLTASTLILYLSQLGYVYIRTFCEKKLLPQAVNITTEEFFRLRDAGSMLITGLNNIKLRRKIYNYESPIQIKLRKTRLVCFKRSLFGRFRFEVANNAFSGKVDMAIIQDS